MPNIRNMLSLEGSSPVVGACLLRLVRSPSGEITHGLKVKLEVLQQAEEEKELEETEMMRRAAFDLCQFKTGKHADYDATGASSPSSDNNSYFSAEEDEVFYDCVGYEADMDKARADTKQGKVEDIKVKEGETTQRDSQEEEMAEETKNRRKGRLSVNLTSTWDLISEHESEDGSTSSSSRGYKRGRDIDKEAMGSAGENDKEGEDSGNRKPPPIKRPRVLRMWDGGAKLCARNQRRRGNSVVAIGHSRNFVA